jgi:hypothetical protein
VNALARIPTPDRQADAWSERLRQTLQAYDEPLLRGLASKLFKPRNQWPVEELIERSLTTLGNAPVIDRRLQELDVAERRVLALIGHSRQPRWALGNLVELVIALGHSDGLPPILHLFESGLLFPCLPERVTRLKSFEQWMTLSAPTGLHVFAPPQITGRVLKEDLGLPELDCSADDARSANATVHEVDGLDWPLRLAVLWQRVAAAPLRRTQQGGFFKRDLERLTLDALLNDPPSDSLAELPDPAMVTAALAERCGLVEEADGELRAAKLPAVWERGLHATLADLFAALPHITSWDALRGWHGDADVGRGNPFPSAYLLALLLVARLPAKAWADPDAIESWIVEHHPYWKSGSLRPSRQQSWVPTFLLGLAYQLKLLQAAKGHDGGWRVRLSPLGRWLLCGGPEPTEPPSFPQTLMVQPNLEVIAYRQGLTPPLIGQLSLFAAWKNLGAACLLTLDQESVYRALQAEQSFDTILQTLTRHGMRPVPPAVVDSLKTWAGKRERLTIYPSATLFEFASAEELSDAIARGLPATRLSDRLAVVPSENGVDFRHFRLTGTRDYGLPPDKCVEVEADGVTLNIDLARSDLLVETEMQRFALPLEVRMEGRRVYQVTPGSMAAARDSGMGVRQLEEWFTQRTGQALPAAARLLLVGSQLPAAELHRQLVLHVPTAEVADGMLQWPRTRGLIQERLGPVTLVIAEEDLERLRERLSELGVSVQLNP